VSAKWDERRREPRFDMRLPLVLTRCNDQPVFKNTFSRDISSQGIYFYLDSEMSPDVSFEFILTLPPSQMYASLRMRYAGRSLRVHPLGDGSFGVAAVIKSRGIADA